jgi:hypothetical protein
LQVGHSIDGLCSRDLLRLGPLQLLSQVSSVVGRAVRLVVTGSKAIAVESQSSSVSASVPAASASAGSAATSGHAATNTRQPDFEEKNENKVLVQGARAMKK